MDTFVEFRGIRRVSQKRFRDTTSRFPSLAPAGGCSPVSTVLSRRYDALPPSHRTSFPSLGGPRFHSFLSLLGGRVHRRGLELVTRYLQPGICREANRVLPSSWGTPSVRLRMFFDSGRTACTRPIWSSSMALGMRKTKAPTTSLSKLNSMAFGLAVYASWCGLLQPHARLPSSRWSDAAGWAFHPQGSYERFQSGLLTCSSSSPKLLGAISSTHRFCRTLQKRTGFGTPTSADALIV